MPEPTTTAASRFALILDGSKTAGFLKSLSGGSVSADVFEEASGPAGFVNKHIGAPKYQEFTVQVDMSMTSDLYDWINASWQAKPQRKNGAVVAGDFNYIEKSRREFFGALITEISFPPCDASSKDPVYLTVKFAPEYTRYTKGSGKKLTPMPSQTQKAALGSNFRLTIDGLDCTRVAKIDAFAVRQTVSGSERMPGRIEIPNLTFWLPEAHATTWLAWHEDFVINGMNSEDREKSGTLELLSADLKTPLLTIAFHNVGIFNLSLQGAGESDQIGMVKADLYCERMELLTGKAALSRRAARAPRKRRPAAARRR